MTDNNAAVRYAQALYAATDPKERAALSVTLTQVVEVLAEPAIQRFLLHPRTEMAAKRQLVGRLELAAPLRRFLLLVMEKGRDRQLAAMASEFERLVYQHQNKTVAQVTSAVRLSDEAVERLTETLSGATGKQVVLDTKTDEAILGGIIIEMDGKVMNASTSASLQRLKQRLLSSP